MDGGHGLVGFSFCFGNGEVSRSDVIQRSLTVLICGLNSWRSSSEGFSRFGIIFRVSAENDTLENAR